MTTDNSVGGERIPLALSADTLEPSFEQLPKVRHPQTVRFRVALSALVGIAVAAVTVAVVLATGGKSIGQGAGISSWSSWAPSGTSGQAVTEISQHIAPYYRLTGSQQLDVITPMSVSQITSAGTTVGSGPIVVVNQSNSITSQSLALLGGKTIAYNICGLGASNCSLAGTPSTYRMLLLRREALELALYTFRYVSDAQNVVAVLPPGKTVRSGSNSITLGSPVTVAVVFIRKQLQPLLNVPLTSTLQQYPPDVAQLKTWSKTTEAGLVDQITAHSLFSSQLENQQVGGKLLVLSPLPAQ